MARKMTAARRRFYILFPFLCFLVFAYPAYRLANWYAPEVAIGIGQTMFIWLFASVALWYSFRSPNMRMRYAMVHWMGVSFILLVLTAGYEIVRLVMLLIMPLNDRIAVVWILGGCTVLVTLAVIASHFLRVKHIELHSQKITRAYRIVQISDVHIGSRRAGYLTRIVHRINQLAPDLVVITGDLVDSAAVGHEQLKCLAQLRVQTLFSIGNHERYADLNKVIRLLREFNIETLRQQSVIAGELQIIGIDDADAHDQVATMLPTVPPSVPPRNNPYTVLLYHRPLGWEAAVEHGVDLMLSGHTHNGQIFPFNLLVKQQFRRISGLYTMTNSGHDAHLYVSPGTGTWGPLMRLGSFNEITCIQLKPTPAPKSVVPAAC